MLTSKHHDGIALWNTKTNSLNVMQNTPAKRVLVGPFIDALRYKNICAGLYYSLPDRSHPVYPLKSRDNYRYRDDTVQFNKFLTFQQQQLPELMQRVFYFTKNLPETLLVGLASE